MRGRMGWRPPALAALAVLAAAPAGASGFAVYDQGARATALGGAFVAQADDNTAIFYNVGGLALAPKKKLLSAGVTAVSRNALQFQGRAPGIGAGTTGEQGSELALQPHVYWIKPIGDRGVVGAGAFFPFALSTDWSDPGAFAGRRVATSASIDVYDLNPVVAWKIGDRLGVGAGVFYRLSEVSVARRYPGTDPFGGGLIDFATLDFDSDMEGGVGFNAGALARLGSLSVGLAYRSGVSIDHAGSATLTAVPTGNDQLDALIAASLPLGRELAARTTVDYPATAAVGVALRFGKASAVELDAVQTGWSSVEELAVELPNDPEFDRVYPQELDDTLDLRLGVRVLLASQFELRFGVSMEESPQPTATAGPLWVGADRTAVSAGLGRDWLDVAVSWFQLDDVAVTDSVDGLNGGYSGDGFSLSVTVSK